jgi:acetyl coenzyme A synthetase (ADP forming)-like protein
MLDALFSPRSIAIIGASADPKKVGHAVLNNLIRFGFPGDLYPVNPSCSTILGRQTVARIADIGKPVDLAVIVIPAALVPDTLTQCADASIPVAIVISAGFKEAGAEGTRREQDLAAISRARKIRVLGPNCLGVINTAARMNATFAADMLPRGNIGFFSQSGAMGIAIMDWAIGNNIGFSKFASLGNKADLSETELIAYLADDPETRIILGYIEDVVDGRHFLETAARATARKPVVLLKSGGTEAGARAASSHTGALAGSDIAFDAAFKQTGVIRAAGVQDLFDTALAFAEGKVPAGDRLLVITNAGGPGIIAADTAERLKVKLPQMTRESVTEIAKRLPPNASFYNPVDVIGDATTERYAAVLEQGVKDPNVDGMLVILTPQAMTNAAETADAVIAAARSTSKPVITSFMGEARVREAIGALKRASIPNFSYPELAVKAFRRLADHHAWITRREEQPLRFPTDSGALQRTMEDLRARGIYRAGEDDAAAILGAYGFRFPKKILTRTAEEAATAGRSLGFPVVMKIVSPEILHKTDVGGVKLNIRNAKEAERAFLEITTNSRRHMPEATILGVLVSEMVRGGKEIILGVTYDRTFGHLLMFGLGGIYVEVLKDVAFRVAPVTRGEAEAMVHEVRTVALLQGARGERPVDVDAVVDGLQRLSCLVTDLPDIRELDINPLVVQEQGAVALDARIIFRLPADG